MSSRPVLVLTIGLRIASKEMKNGIILNKGNNIFVQNGMCCLFAFFALFEVLNLTCALYYFLASIVGY
jgi:hypothetical protein